MISPRWSFTKVAIQLNTDQYLKLKKCRSGKNCRWRPFNVWPLAEGSRWASVTFVLMSERRRCPYKARFSGSRGGRLRQQNWAQGAREGSSEGKTNKRERLRGNSPELSFPCIKTLSLKQNRLPHNVQISLLSISSSLPASWTSWARPCSAPPPPSSPGR